MLCDMAVNGVPILFHISYGAPDLPVTSPKEKDSHQLKDRATEFFWIFSCLSLCPEKVQKRQWFMQCSDEDNWIKGFLMLSNVINYRMTNSCSIVNLSIQTLQLRILNIDKNVLNWHYFSIITMEY